MSPAALDLDGLGKRWGDVVALDGVSFDVRDGELMTLVGPSGSGKSTLLRIVAGIEPHDGGTVAVAGRDVTALAPKERGVAMMFQSFALFPHLDVAENIAFGLRARGVPKPERDTRVAEVAERLELGGLLKRRPAALSGGERQRVALARGLVGRPQLLLLDEPLSNLDAQLRSQARAEIARVQAEESIAMLYVTHDQAEALSLGHRMVVLRAGRIQQVGAPEAVYDRPANAFVAGFLGSPPMALLPGEVAGGEVRTAGGGPALPLPADAALRPGERVLAGIRPEDVRLGGDGGFGAQVESVELAGHEQIWHLRSGEARLAARAPRGPAPAPGTAVRATVDPSAIRLFDAETGTAR